MALARAQPLVGLNADRFAILHGYNDIDSVIEFANLVNERELTANLSAVNNPTASPYFPESRLTVVHEWYLSDASDKTNTYPARFPL